ncbi:MAG TPA: PAS domain S-box protein, partial [Burkholderiales bacterium]|nr:PAS domain S-box protein [Burkholderiales bacterium]
MPGILYFYDENGKFLRWNRNFETVSGYSAEEISRMHPLDFFSEKEKETLRQRIAEVFAKGESFIEASFLAKDGSATPYYFTGRRVVLDERPCLVGMGIDVSERMKAELELRLMQGRLEAVVENLREGLVIADPEVDLLRWNPESLRILGFEDLDEGRRRQREFADIFELHTLDGKSIPAENWPLARVRRGEPLDDFQARVRRIGSEWERIISYTGSRVSYAGARTLAFLTLQDITDRKKAETALRGDMDELERQVAARTSDLKTALVRAEAADRIKSAFLATMSHELRTPLNSIIGFTGILVKGMAGPLNPEQSRQLGMVQGSARHLLELINDVLDISKIEAGQTRIHLENFDLRLSLERVLSSIRPMAEKKGIALDASIP